MKKILVVVVTMILAGWGGFCRLQGGSQASVAFRTVPVERGNLVVAITATGTVEPEEVIDVGAQVAGQILSFGRDVNGKSVDYGSVVEAGTVLATIDDALYTSEVAQAEAQVLAAQGGLQRAQGDLEQMRAKLYEATRNWDRARQLETSSALAATDYDSFKSAYDSARANILVGEAAIVQAKGGLAQAQSQLERARRNLGYTTIKSPVKGVIIDRRVNIGQTVVASLNAPSLFLIAKDLTRIQVWVAVNEADIGKLHPGQPVAFTVDAFPGESFNGRLGKIRLNAAMTQNVVTYTVEVTADNSNGRLLPYLTANVKFELNRHDSVLMVPNAALKWTPAAEQVSPKFRGTVPDPSASEPEPGGAPASSRPAAEEQGESTGIVWVTEGQFVRPVCVTTGLTDDVVTEVNGQEIVAGLQVVTGVEEQPETASSTTGSPFLPKPPNRGKGVPPPPM